ncbi:hypothetical protein B0H10DRAFT_1997340 [Mycena sp. CBHHK59/15]|nr:hypothetical protein B0H10DRAFT_1997340 [Mycena sp. CBHHK59/15]
MRHRCRKFARLPRTPVVLLHDFHKLPGLVWAVPYVTLPTTWAFVMEDECSGEVVGYIVGPEPTSNMRRRIEYLKGEGIDGMWLVMNPKNLNARKFYQRLGFTAIKGSPENHVGVRFSELV